METLVVPASSPAIDAAGVMAEQPSTVATPADPFADMPTLDELERRYLVYALERLHGNRTRTAAALGIDRRTLYRMSARLGVPISAAGSHHGGSSGRA